jgi:hypothetical protein
LQEVENCGFVSWLDGDWPVTMKNSLDRLWSMYHESNYQRVDERIVNAKLVD